MTKAKLETIEPVGLRVLIRKDEDKKVTKGGIALPDCVEIPVLTGRVVAISEHIEHDVDYSLRALDKVIYDPRGGIPVDLEHDNCLFVVPIEDVVAIIRKT